MKKHLLIILITLFAVKINAQCTVATPTVSENFNSTVLPTCWTNLNGWSLSGTDIWASEDNNWTPMLILPKTDNAKGILTFKARMNSAFGPPAMYIGVVSAPGSPASYVNIFNFNVTNATMTTFTVDLSSYTGNFQYIAIRLPSNNGRRLHLDDINYTSACFSSSVTAIAQNYTVQLNSNGQKSITGLNIDNGSTTTCGAPTLSVNPSLFDCSNVGINTVTLTASDNNGHVATTTASVTILPAINNETVTVAQNTICSGKSATITTGASINGVNYYLRDDATNSIVAGPIVGTGNALAFNSGSLTANTTFNVYGETPGTNVYALDFDGTNDVITTNITSLATNSLTVEAWIFPRATTYKRIVSNYFANAAQSGEIILDTYNTTNNGRGLRFVVEGSGNKLHQLSVANVLTLNAWNHVAGTFNNGVTTLYLNGTAISTSTAPFTSIPSCTNKLTIGEDPTIGTAEYFNGKMVEVRIWNTAGTQSEIAGNMDNCLIGNESGLRTYFKINENIGSTVTDLVTGGVGTMSGMDPNTDWIVGKVDCGAPVCNLEMTDLITITIAPNPTIAVNSGSICSGNSFTITPSGANTYTIQGGSSVKTPTANTSYTVVGTSSVGCISTTFATSSVTVNALPTINATSDDALICVGKQRV
ncbi:MAG: LamG domain-containing protein [Bacteroidetes bacterium]|nr:LamG domain-containing protein [Bacteroidota bacterium]